MPKLEGLILYHVLPFVKQVVKKMLPNEAIAASLGVLRLRSDTQGFRGGLPILSGISIPLFGFNASVCFILPHPPLSALGWLCQLSIVNCPLRL
jgi:hypothetical protein